MNRILQGYIKARPPEWSAEPSVSETTSKIWLSILETDVLQLKNQALEVLIRV